jgi:hypothetical protein
MHASLLTGSGKLPSTPPCEAAPTLVLICQKHLQELLEAHALMVLQAFAATARSV